MNITQLNSIHSMVFTVGRIMPDGVQLLGTCFLVDSKGNLATAAHVTSNDDRNLVIVTSGDRDISTYQDTSILSIQYLPVKIVAVDTFRDICILNLGQLVNYNLAVGGANNVNVSESLSVIGFPHCTEGRRVLTYQHTMVGAKVLIESSGIKSKHLILNIQAKPGQSGSPVFKDSDSRLVAMLIGSYAPGGGGGISLGGVDPQTLHQTTHAISSEYIFEML